MRPQSPDPQNRRFSRRSAAIGAIAAVLFMVFTASLLAWLTVADYRAYWQLLSGIERACIETLPVYEDYATPEMEGRLRSFLLPYHLQAARAGGLEAVADERALAALVRNGRLRALQPGGDGRYYFYNVRPQYRYLTPGAAKGLDGLTARFQENLQRHRSGLPPVKIALSSVLRPVNYQGALQGRNVNATAQSSHPHGISFDIFYDEFRMVLPGGRARTPLSGALMTLTRRHTGPLMGSSLRRQFRSVLMETLIQLQEEGVLYAILEKNQRCYHVTILPGR